MTKSAPITERRYIVPLAMVTSLFFVWAIGVNLNDVLIQHLKKAFGLTDFQSSLIQSAFFGGVLPGGVACGLDHAADRIQTRNSDGSIGLCNWNDLVYSSCFGTGIRVFPVCALCDGLRSVST